jgi:hypothetical protein
MSPKRVTAIRRVQKLRALADAEAASGNTNAADSALRIAARLMLAHEIAVAEVDVKIRTSEDPIQHRVHVGRRLVWIRSLHHAVATANNCTTAYVQGSDIVFYYGAPADCEIVEYLAVYLAKEVQREADAYVKQARSKGVKGDRNGFCCSAVAALSRRMRAMRREAAEEARKAHGAAAVGNALVRLDNKLALATEFRSTFNLGKRRATHYRGNAAGHAAGNRININKGLGGTTPVAKLG